MADVSTLQPAILPDTSAGAEPRSYWSTVGERLAHDRITLAVGAVLLCVILLAIFAVIGAGIGNTILSLMIVFTPPIVRVTESLTAQVKNRDFVEAARASAAPLHAIIRHQILPNVLGGMLVYATSLVGISIIL